MCQSKEFYRGLDYLQTCNLQCFTVTVIDIFETRAGLPIYQRGYQYAVYIIEIIHYAHDSDFYIALLSAFSNA